MAIGAGQRNSASSVLFDCLRHLARYGVSRYTAEVLPPLSAATATRVTP